MNLSIVKIPLIFSLGLAANAGGGEYAENEEKKPKQSKSLADHINRIFAEKHNELSKRLQIQNAMIWPTLIGYKHYKDGPVFALVEVSITITTTTCEYNWSSYTSTQTKTAKLVIRLNVTGVTDDGFENVHLNVGNMVGKQFDVSGLSWIKCMTKNKDDYKSFQKCLTNGENRMKVCRSLNLKDLVGMEMDLEAFTYVSDTNGVAFLEIRGCGPDKKVVLVLAKFSVNRLEKQYNEFMNVNLLYIRRLNAI